MQIDVRGAEEAEIGYLAKLWSDGWQDAHAQILPAELTRIRTLAMRPSAGVGPPASPGNSLL